MSQHNEAGDVIAHRKLGRGEWLVVATAMTGGGFGHGQYDEYPNGYQLILRKLADHDCEFRIDWDVPEKRFYQSGAFIDEVTLPAYIAPRVRLAGRVSSEG